MRAVAVRGLAALAILALTAAAGPGGRTAGGSDEASLLERWRKADPEGRRRLGQELETRERGRRYAAARPVLVEFGGRRIPLAELFETILEPAILAPTVSKSESDPGLVELHREALAALEALRAAYAPPRPARPGTLNLLLGFAARALSSRAIPRHLRVRFFREAVRNIREFDGRVEPNARTSWLIHNRLLPALLGLARRARRDDPLKQTVSEAASLLYLPSILDERAQAKLAPLTSGVHSRDILVRFYRAGILDDLGRVSLARSVAAQARDDAAFAAGAAPLLLELLSDPRIAPAERGVLVDVILTRLAKVEVLRPAVVDLLAAAFGGVPGKLEHFVAARKLRKGGVARPTGDRVFRFLSVVLVQAREEAPPEIARVLRRDLTIHQPLYAADSRGGRRFVGTLVPDASGAHADFLGPPPGVGRGHDNRLLRRRLRLERISIATFGPRGEETELCLTLPEDASEPVPVEGATLPHVVALVGARLQRATGEEERRELVRLLLRIGTAPAYRLAMKHADTRGALESMIPLAEHGSIDAAHVILKRLGELDHAQREQALGAVLSTGDAGVEAETVKLTRDESVATAVLAADALLAAGSTRGVESILTHPDKYTRASGIALALRLTPLAGSLRVTPAREPDLAKLGRLAGRAFKPEDGDSFVRLGKFASLALVDPDKVHERRRNHKPLYLGKRSVLGWEFADAYAEAIREGKGRDIWPALAAFLLDPHDPGAGILQRHLDPLLDELEKRATEEKMKTAWIDANVVLACAQYGIEMDPQFLDLAHARLTRAAGGKAPPDTRRKAGVYWPIWARKELRR